MCVVYGVGYAIFIQCKLLWVAAGGKFYADSSSGPRSIGIVQELF